MGAFSRDCFNVFTDFSIKLDFPYQFHALFIRKWLNDKSEPVLKEKSELNFVFGMMATMLLIAFY